jgi:hypothetical protein
LVSGGVAGAEGVGVEEIAEDMNTYLSWKWATRT